MTPAGDILVTLLTPQGKLKAVARGGVRGPLSSRLNLFHHVGMQVYQGPQNDLASVQQAVLEGALPTLAQPERYAFAHLLAEFAEALYQEGNSASRPSSCSRAPCAASRTSRTRNGWRSS